jgi:predicted Zn-dependent protease with MMP-like domain
VGERFAAVGRFVLPVALLAILALLSSTISSLLAGLFVGAAILLLIGGVIAALGVRAAGWDPVSEDEFDRVIEHSERLARDGLYVDPDETDFMTLDPMTDDGFNEIVADALDDLPDILRRALRNLAVIVTNGGARHNAYGLYEGDGARDDVANRIVIFRDTLRRDFGHDADLLQEQITVTVRHELAHHLGADELGVRDLGLD